MHSWMGLKQWETIAVFVQRGSRNSLFVLQIEPSFYSLANYFSNEF